MSPKKAVYRLATSGLPILSRLQSLENAEAIGIVTVHGVHEEKDSFRLSPPRHSISLKAFEANLLGLARAYTFLSMDEVTAI